MGNISPKKKMALVAITATAALAIVAIGVTTFEPKAEDESVNRLPFAAFDYETDGLSVAVNASESMDPDGSIANYTWDFGDGAEGYGILAAHEYDDNGTYTVMLSLADNQGGKNSTSLDVIVSVDVVVKDDPIATIEMVSNVNGTVVLSASGSHDPDGGDIAAYSWAFSDGSTVEGVNVTYTFAANGTYTVTLTVTDDDGACGMATQDLEIEIECVSPPPSEEPRGPPGLLKAIEHHEERVDDMPQLQTSLDHLLENLDRWLEKHSEEK